MPQTDVVTLRVPQADVGPPVTAAAPPVAEAGGLHLALSASNDTGYAGVSRNGGRFRASLGGQNVGSYGSAFDAAVAIAQHQADPAARQSAAAAMVARRQSDAAAMVARRSASGAPERRAAATAAVAATAEAEAKRRAAATAAAQAKLDAAGAKQAFLEDGRRRLEQLGAEAHCEASVRALLADIAKSPALGCLMPELWAFLRERIEPGETCWVMALLPELLAADAAPLEHPPGHDERLVDRRVALGLPAERLNQGYNQRRLLGGEARAEAEALLKAREEAAQEAAFREHWATQPASPGGPASLSQQKLDYTFTNPTDFENWHPHLRQWAMRMGLHLRWTDLAHVPGGVRLRAENMLNALSGFMMLTVDGKDVASIAVSETYGQQVPALGTDVREWLLRGWWWRLDGKLVFVGCVQSARQLAYLLHNRTGARLPHSPPKPGDGQFTPFNMFLDPRFHLYVVAPTETVSQVNVLLARRVVAKRKSQLKFEDASAPGANKPRSMGDLQFDALQRHPDAHLMYVANPSDAADYTPAGRLPYWFAAFCAPPDSPPLDEANIGETLQRFEEQGCRLTDAGPLACNEKAFSDWKAQPSQPAPEDGKVMVDPASCTKHFTGNTTTRKLPPNCLAETSYGVTTPDPDAPPELPTDQSTGLTVVRAGRMHPQRG